MTRTGVMSELTVARGSDTPAVYDDANTIKYAIQVAAFPAANGLARIDLDYAAIWKLPAPLPERKP